jgi:hypothetical protein
MQKIRLVRRPRPLALPHYTGDALEAIMTHIEEILSLEYARKPIRKASPAAQPRQASAA